MGTLTDNQKAYLATRASCFALPSHYEGVGLAALEAASVGANICITDRGGASDYFAKYGHYVDPQSIKSITKGVANAINTPKSDALAKHVNKHYSLTAYAGRLIKSYCDVIESTGG
jgi:glycosyltransferase involved in cell wall biosynthesis